eukprot:6204707-Pyramimonas_sp.AAC.1
MALKGFRRLAPGLSRAPLPWIGLCALVGGSPPHGRAGVRPVPDLLVPHVPEAERVLVAETQPAHPA